MTTIEMIQRLRKHEYVNLEEVADRLQDLAQVIDDMMNDHYTDYLEWYAQRCWELEEENAKLKDTINNTKL